MVEVKEDEIDIFRRFMQSDGRTVIITNMSFVGREVLQGLAKPSWIFQLPMLARCGLDSN